MTTARADAAKEDEGAWLSAISPITAVAFGDVARATTGEAKEREQTTHTHTHTQREREREQSTTFLPATCVDVCVGAGVPFGLVCECSGEQGRSVSAIHARGRTSD